VGLLDALFGSKKPQDPPLDPASPVAARLARHQASLDGLAARVRDSLEAVPGERTLYVFIGKPPEMFGIAWFNGGEELSLRTIMKARGLPPARVQRISDDVRDLYVRHQGAPRFSGTAAGKAVTVTDAAALCADLDGVIDEVEAG
jgi:hypothetical protein